MRRTTLTNALTKGVLDQNLSERVDLAHYHASLADGDNCLFTPQGGVLDRGGTALISDVDVLALGVPRRLRRRLNPVIVTSSMLTAPNGGTASNILDADVATVLTTSSVAATPWVVVSVDLGAAQTVSAVDLIAFRCDTTPINETVSVEWYDGAAWQTFGGVVDNAARKHIRTTARTRRFAGWPGQSTSARYWRVVLTGAVGAGAVSLGGFRMWNEAPVMSPTQLFTVARSASEHYELSLSEWNVDVYRNGRWQAAIPVPVAAQQVQEVSIESSLDTVLMLHEQIETIEIVRQGSDGEWNAAPWAWENVPDLSTTTAFSGSQDEMQTMIMPADIVGKSVYINIGERRTAPITYTSDAAFAAAAATAIAAAVGISTADLIVSVPATRQIRVSFVAAAGSRSWPLVTASIVGAVTLPADTVVNQRGLDASGSAKLWSETTGWPRAAAFVQSRLMVGGFRAAPSTWRLSVVADYRNFEGVGSPATADRAFGGALDVDEIETILHIFVGRHIQIFTESGEWFIEARTLDATQPVNAVLATRAGISPRVPPVFADGTTMFMQAGGETLQEYSYTEAEQSYRSDPVSVLAPHLVRGVVSLAARQARSVREGSLLAMVNGDGTVAMLTLLRSQEVVAVAPWSTPSGAFRAVVANIAHDLVFLVERDGDLYMETWQRDMPLDCATRVRGNSIASVSGLPFPDGREVWAYIDGDCHGPLTVASGAVTLPVTGSDVTVGLAPPWRARFPVVRAKPGQEQPWRPPMRIYEAELALVSTGQVTIATNGKSHREVPLLKENIGVARGGPLQTANGGDPSMPLMQRLYTGTRRVQGLTGWSPHAFVELSRFVPAPVHVKSLRVEVAHG